MEWQPIETAPKNGTWILVINGTTNRTRQHVVYYDTCGGKFPWTRGSGAMSFIDGITHWMPLPEAPNDKLRG